MNRSKTLFLALMALASTSSFAAGRIQRADIKTATDCVNAGSTAANCLPNTAQIYDSFNNQQLSTSIANGQLGTAVPVVSALSSVISTTPIVLQGGTNTTVVFSTINFDSVGGYSSGIYTVPAGKAGFFYASAAIDTANSLADNSIVIIKIWQNASVVSEQVTVNSQGNVYAPASATALINAAAGDTIKVTGTITNGAGAGSYALGASTNTNGNGNYFNLESINTSGTTFSASSATTTSTNGSDVTVVNPTVIFDSASGYNSSTGVYTVPAGKAGYAWWCAGLDFGANFTAFTKTATIKLVQNATVVVSQTNESGPSANLAVPRVPLQACAPVKLAVGDTLRVKVNNNSASYALSGTVGNYNFLMSLPSAPVVMLGTSSTSTSAPTVTTPVFPTASIDTNNRLNTSSGVYTFPMTGYYVYAAGLDFSTNFVGALGKSNLWVYLNAASVASNTNQNAAAGYETPGFLSGVIYANAGDTAQVEVQNNQGTFALSGGVGSYFSIALILPAAINGVKF